MNPPLNPCLALLATACWSAVAMAAPQPTALNVGGTGITLGTMQLLAKVFEQANPGVNVNVLSSLGSTGGIKAVIAGAINIGVSARPLTDDERRQGAVAHEYGRSPLVFAVPRTFGVSGVTMAQLIDIYAAKMDRWPDGTRIRLILRPATEISTIVLANVSPQMRDAVAAAGKRPGMLFALTDQETMENIEKIPGSIGATALCEILTTAPRLKPLALDGVVPSAATIADGSYPMYHRLYLVTGTQPDALTEQFIDFVRSEAGKQILTGAGHWVTGHNEAR